MALNALSKSLHLFVCLRLVHVLWPFLWASDRLRVLTRPASFLNRRQARLTPILVSGLRRFGAKPPDGSGWASDNRRAGGSAFSPRLREGVPGRRRNRPSCGERCHGSRRGSNNRPAKRDECEARRHGQEGQESYKRENRMSPFLSPLKELVSGFSPSSRHAASDPNSGSGTPPPGTSRSTTATTTEPPRPLAVITPGGP